MSKTFNQPDLIDIYRTLFPTAVKDILFKYIEMFHQKDQMLRHKTSHNTFENNKYKELCPLIIVELT